MHSDLNHTHSTVGLPCTWTILYIVQPQLMPVAKPELHMLKNVHGPP